MLVQFSLKFRFLRESKKFSIKVRTLKDWKNETLPSQFLDRDFPTDWGFLSPFSLQAFQILLGCSFEINVSTRKCEMVSVEAG